MPGKTIGISMNFGYPGTYSRNADCIIINRPAGGDIPFGKPVVMNGDNTISLFDPASDTAEDFIGVAVREVKQQTDYYSTDVVYKDEEPMDCITRGSVVVEVTGGTPAANAPVGILIAADATNFPSSEVGDFVAGPDGTSAIELGNVVFTTGKIDSNNVAEITVLSRKA